MDIHKLSLPRACRRQSFARRCRARSRVNPIHVYIYEHTYTYVFIYVWIYINLAFHVLAGGKAPLAGAGHAQAHQRGAVGADHQAALVPFLLRDGVGGQAHHQDHRCMLGVPLIYMIHIYIYI